VETPLSRYLRRRLRDPDILTYYDKFSKNLVVGTYFHRAGGVVTSHVAVLPGHEDMAVQSVLWQRSPQNRLDLLSLRETIWSQEMDDIEAWDEDAQTHLDMVEFLRRKATIHNRDNPIWNTL